MRWFAILLLGLVPSFPLSAAVNRLGFDGYRVGFLIEDAVPSPDGLTFAVRAGPESVFLLETASGLPLHRWDGLPQVQQMQFTHDGLLMVRERGGLLTTLNPRSGCVVRQFQLPRFADVICGRFHAEGRLWNQIRRHTGGLRALDDQDFLDPVTGSTPAWAEGLWMDHHWTLSDDGRRLATYRDRPVLTNLIQKYARFEDALAEHHLLRVLDTRDGRVLYQRRTERESVSQLTLSPDGKYLFLGIQERLLVVEVDSGKERELTLQGRPPENGALDRLVIAPDGSRLALREFAGCNITVCEWDTGNGQLLGFRCLENTKHLDIGYTTRGRLLLWERRGTRLEVYDRETGPLQPARGHVAPLREVAFTADGREVVSCDEQHRVCRWEIATGRLLSTSQAAPEPEQGLRSPDGRWQLEGQNDQPPVLVDRKTQRRMGLPAAEEICPGSQRAPATPTFSADGRFLMETLIRRGATDQDPPQLLAVVYKTHSAKRLGQFPVEMTTLTSPALFGPNGDWLAFSHDDRITRFDIRTGRARQVLLPPTDEGTLTALALSPDGRCVLTLGSRDHGASNGELRLVEWASGAARRTWTWHQTRASSTLPCFSPDGKWIAMPLDDGTIRLLSTACEATPSDRATLWRDLASADAVVAGAAVEALLELPHFDRWLRARQPDRPPTGELNALFWLAELEHDDPQRREAARRQLAAQPDRLDELEALLTERTSPELSRVLAELREPGNGPLPPEVLRRVRLEEIAERRSRREGTR